MRIRFENEEDYPDYNEINNNELLIEIIKELKRLNYTPIGVVKGDVNKSAFRFIPMNIKMTEWWTQLTAFFQFLTFIALAILVYKGW